MSFRSFACALFFLLLFMVPQLSAQTDVVTPAHPDWMIPNSPECPNCGYFEGDPVSVLESAPVVWSAPVWSSTPVVYGQQPAVMFRAPQRFGQRIYDWRTRFKGRLVQRLVN